MTDNTPITLTSKLDPSVNHIFDGFETRFVVRDNQEAGLDKVDVIIYLSSFKGCDQSCRMCWLTQQGQTSNEAATLSDFSNQATHSLKSAAEYLYKTDKKIASVHFNFMARGEPLLNPVIRHAWEDLANGLMLLAASILPPEGGVGLLDTWDIKFKISTILSGIYERDEHGTIVEGMQKLPFDRIKPEIYYSLYSVNPDFRKRWLPKAEDPQEALRLLSTYSVKGGPVRFHGAFIFGHNDDLNGVRDMLNAINFFGLPKKFNIVRYNSPDLAKSEETPMEQILGIKKYMESKGYEVQIVERVGYDVKASCGTFVSDKELENHANTNTREVRDTTDH